RMRLLELARQRRRETLPVAGRRRRAGGASVADQRASERASQPASQEHGVNSAHLPSAYTTIVVSFWIWLSSGPATSSGSVASAQPAKKTSAAAGRWSWRTGATRRCGR